jgi:hypothetical protein
LGSLNMLGNPLGLVTELYSGMTDIFKEPARELQSGRLAGRQSAVQVVQDLTRGLERGSRSLLRHSVLGWTDTIAKASSSIARFLAYLSMDEAFASDMSKAADERDDGSQIGLFPGLLVSIGSLARVPSLAARRAWTQPHLSSAWALFPVTGPAQAHESDQDHQADGGAHARRITVIHRAGAALPALVQGCVQALVGVAAKPAAGLLDTVAQTCLSFQDAALSFLGADAAAGRQRRQRLRPPRFFGPDKVRHSASLPCLYVCARRVMRGSGESAVGKGSDIS